MDVREENGRRHALPCGFLLGRTIACLTTLTLGTSMVARQGPIAMAAHQICIQVWLAVSLLTDAMAASGQALIASYLSKGEYKIVKEVVDSVLKIGLFTGISLSVILGVPFGSLATLFTNDPEVLAIVRSGILVRTQIYVWRYISLDSCKCRCLEHRFCICCSLHEVEEWTHRMRRLSSTKFKGLFLFYANQMVVGAISSAFLLYAPSIFGLHGVWLGLTLFMACAQSRLCQISVKIRPVVVRAQGYPDTSASQLRLAKSIRLNGIIRRVTPTSRREVSAANCAFVSIFVLYDYSFYFH
ncbi:protein DETOXIFICATION 45, chloroplastic-like [Malus sylvestris]|uniref:protein DETOXIFICATION 45, chloroplastic-like n=1 Tax=Malus sylvestris TaxID=3752 RepID=UPI0021AD335E|nr:protein DETOXIFICATION 45, chloroplastic-like [Malus sylvestris]